MSCYNFNSFFNTHYYYRFSNENLKFLAEISLNTNGSKGKGLPKINLNLREWEIDKKKDDQLQAVAIGFYKGFFACCYNGLVGLIESFIVKRRRK